MGNKGFENKIDYLQSIKAYCVSKVDNSEKFEMLAPAAYLNILFRYKPANFVSEEHSRELNIKITKTMMKEGGAYVDYAKFKGRSGIRLILANQDVTEKHIDKLLLDCERIGADLESS